MQIIHYIAATGAVAEGDLVLVDAGCEYHGYSSDITRTWPAAGSWSPAQLELYEALLAVQLQLVAGIRPGLHNGAIRMLMLRVWTCTTAGGRTSGGRWRPGW